MKFLPINQSSVYPKPVLCTFMHNIHEPSDIELMINLILAHAQEGVSKYTALLTVPDTNWFPIELER